VQTKHGAKRLSEMIRQAKRHLLNEQVLVVREERFLQMAKIMVSPTIASFA